MLTVRQHGAQDQDLQAAVSFAGGQLLPAHQAKAADAKKLGSFLLLPAGDEDVSQLPAAARKLHWTTPALLAVIISLHSQRSLS